MMLAEIQEPRNGEFVEFTGVLNEYASKPQATWETYAFFAGDAAIREQTKNDFLGGYIENPTLDYPLLNEAQMVKATQELGGLAVKIGSIPTKDPMRSDIAYETIAYRWAEVFFLAQAARVAAKHPSDPTRLDEANRLAQMSRELYGVPHTATYLGYLKRSLVKAQDALSKDDSSGVVTIAKELVDRVGAVPDGIPELNYKPAPELIGSLREFVEEEFGEMLSQVPDLPEGEVFTHEQTIQIVSRALAVRGLTEWGAEINENTNVFEANQAARKIYLGRDRELLTPDELKRKLLHEIGVHSQRRHNGDSDADPLKHGLGMPGYLGGEEGVATMFEDIWLGKYREEGVNYVLAIGLAMGLDGSPRDFRGTFEALWRIKALNLSPSHVNDPKEIVRVRSSSYQDCVRVFRGMPADVPGAVFTKDLAYSDKLIVWQEVEAQYNSLNSQQFKAYMKWLLSGKFHPVNERHQHIFKRT